MGDQYDIETAFQLLDIIQGHPGYGVKCYQCSQPITDILGQVIPGIMWQHNSWEPGPKHWDPALGETCPIAWAMDQGQRMEDRMERLRAEISTAKASPRGPYFPAESPE